MCACMQYHIDLYELIALLSSELLINHNPHHSWLGLTSNRTSPFFEGGHGCPKLNAQSFNKVSHTKPLYDATALRADEAWTQNKQSVH